MKRIRKSIGIGLAAIMLATSLTGCSNTQAESAVPDLYEPATIKAATVQVERGNLYNMAELSVTVVPTVEKLSFKEGGFIQSVEAVPGQIVQEGDVLVKLDQSDLDKEVERQERNLNAVYARNSYALQQASLSIDIANLQVTACQEALDAAKKAYDDALVAASQQVSDMAAALQKANDAAAQAEAQAQAAQDAADEAAAAAEEAQAAADATKLNIKYAADEAVEATEAAADAKAAATKAALYAEQAKASAEAAKTAAEEAAKAKDTASAETAASTAQAAAAKTAQYQASALESLMDAQSAKTDALAAKEASDIKAEAGKAKEEEESKNESEEPKPEESESSGESSQDSESGEPEGSEPAGNDPGEEDSVPTGTIYQGVFHARLKTPAAIHREENKAETEFDAETKEKLEKLNKDVIAATYQLQLSQVGVRQAQTAYNQMLSAQAIEVNGLSNDLANLKARYSNTELTAPFTGRVVEFYYYENQWVDAYETVIVIADESRMVIQGDPYNNSALANALRIDAYIDQSAYQIEYQAYDQEDYIKRKLSGEELPSLFSLAETETKELTFGQSGTVRIYTEISENTLVLPIACVLSDSLGSFVYQDVDGVKTKTYVSIGIKTTTSIEIIDGLKEGDVVYVGE